ncbi:acyl-CoA-binding domain-containing protein 3 isoform X2 [Capsella rubella]|uniref:acyl-CoA-binding domain-containing protein 3 isoform X2 n=1 Tax=Capsella rubella TaxID=81985 RepID=UPI000CD4FB78|nr:acyl-CoA-binding domain-containing protein 3 isoform X2 [Capsella rubella]
MDFFLEFILTALLALLSSFLVAYLVSSATPSSDHAENKPEIIGVGDQFETDEVLLSGKKMDARVMESVMNSSAVDDNVELVDRFLNEADRVYEVEEAITGNAVIRGVHEAESTAVLSPENSAIAEKIESAGEIGVEREELVVRTTEAAESTGSVSPGNVVAEEIVLPGQEDRSESTELGTSSCVEKEESGGDVAVAKFEEEVRVEETNTVAENHAQGDDEQKQELSIEDDDDWEGIERSELEKAFAAVANHLEESGKSEGMGAEAKMDLYGLHKIATEGPCREAQPMAVMLSARAKWNAWQKLGNMSQEEAMEQYLALVSKEVPGLMNAGHTVGKMSEMETSVCLPPNSGSLEDPTNLDTTGVDEASKNGER